MSPIIYGRPQHLAKMTPEERAQFADTDVWRRYLLDSREDIDDPGFDPEPYRPGLEARCRNVYEYELVLARDAYRAAFEYLCGEEPYFLAFEGLTVAELRREVERLDLVAIAAATCN